jgi:hypothetical protein
LIFSPSQVYSISFLSRVLRFCSIELAPRICCCC